MRAVAYMAQDHLYKQMNYSEANERGLVEAFLFQSQPVSPAVLDYALKIHNAIDTEFNFENVYFTFTIFY